MSDFGSSSGAGFGQAGRSRRLEQAPRGDPRARRAAQADRSSDALGQGLSRDSQGRSQIDTDALLNDASFLSALALKLEALGFTRGGG